ncbi:hypothetical protein FRZ40_15635 [Paraburkholderia azotifigens]|uniref:Uncharacterized protein n=1 Tax=Paraburkholderia azotifigens TaxID=2057004 RepID=A0A5C6VW95_9BURK|nr:hypothetical protein FRZ40_15635 [Paraburkholderia azotifigens]
MLDHLWVFVARRVRDNLQRRKQEVH